MKDLSEIAFLLVEDDPANAEAVLQILFDNGFDQAMHLGTFEDVVRAEAAIPRLIEKADLVFLDLNLPYDIANDSRSELDNGQRLLQFLDTQRRRWPETPFNVVIISNERVRDEGPMEHGLRNLYPGLVLDVLPKSEMVGLMNSFIKKVRRRNPAVRAARAAALPWATDLERLFETEVSAKDAVEAAKDIVVDMLRRTLEVMEDRRDAAAGVDSIPALLERLKGGFEEKLLSRTRTSDEKWQQFPWRGPLEGHLRAVHAFRNPTIHQGDRPLDGRAAGWVVDRSTLDDVAKGTSAVAVLRLLLDELVRWYVPWYRGVYLPWSKNRS